MKKIPQRRSRSLKELEQKSIYIIREARSQFKNPAVLWSTGKDSTVMLWLLKKAFFDKIPFPVIFIDTEEQFKEIYEFRDRLVKKWNLNLIIAKNEKGIKATTPLDKFKCCTKRKTEALKNVIRKNNFDAIIASIRRDEDAIRGYERYFSPRDKKFKWHIVERKKKPVGDSSFKALQDAELSGWSIFASDFGKKCDHVRIHPLLHWTELEVWEYIKREKIPVNPLYFSMNGKRFRSLGCKPCTKPIKSKAKSLATIIEELKITRAKEREGRSQDKEMIMRRLRALGYM